MIQPLGFYKQYFNLEMCNLEEEEWRQGLIFPFWIYTISMLELYSWMEWGKFEMMDIVKSWNIAIVS